MNVFRRQFDVALGIAIAKGNLHRGTFLKTSIDPEDDELVFINGDTARIWATRGSYVKDREFEDERCHPPARGIFSR